MQCPLKGLFDVSIYGKGLLAFMTLERLSRGISDKTLCQGEI